MNGMLYVQPCAHITWFVGKGWGWRDWVILPISHYQRLPESGSRHMQTKGFLPQTYVVFIIFIFIMEGGCMTWCMCGHQRAIWRCRFLSSAGLGVKFRASTLVASDFTLRTMLPTNSSLHIFISAPHSHLFKSDICATALLRGPWTRSLICSMESGLEPSEYYSKPIPI